MGRATARRSIFHDDEVTREVLAMSTGPQELRNALFLFSVSVQLKDTL